MSGDNHKEHLHEFKEFFYYDEEAHKTIQSERCDCGYAINVRIHH